jgi:hypothetical protein
MQSVVTDANSERSQNHSRVSGNRTLLVKSHSLYGNRTLNLDRVEITLVRAGITLKRVEITLVSVIITRIRVKRTFVCVKSTLCK